MSLSSILFLFLTHLGVGVTLVLAWVGREAGVKFFRFNAGTAALLIGAGLALRPELDNPNLLHTAATVLLVVATAALVVYWATIGRMLARIRPALLWTAIAAGRRRRCSSSARDFGRCTWPDAAAHRGELSELGRAARRRVRRDGARALVPCRAVARRGASAVDRPAAYRLHRRAGGGGCGGCDDRDRGMAAGLPELRAVHFLDRRHLLLAADSRSGLAGPAVLSYLTWETAKIQSTQSATGILYVDFFTVIVGEVLAKYLLLSTKVPL